jgi:GTP-binding protein EngB required for normal cell division
MDDPTTDDNPLSVDQAMDLIGKWETHPGLLLAIFDASRKLRDEVELLRDTKNHMQKSNDELTRFLAQHVRDKKAMQTKLDQLRDTNKNLVRNFDELLKINAEHCKARKAKDAELDQLRAVVAQNNQSLCGIITRWIKPSTN